MPPSPPPAPGVSFRHKAVSPIFPLFFHLLSQSLTFSLPPRLSRGLRDDELHDNNVAVQSPGRKCQDVLRRAQGFPVPLCRTDQRSPDKLLVHRVQLHLCQGAIPAGLLLSLRRLCQRSQLPGDGAHRRQRRCFAWIDSGLLGLEWDFEFVALGKNLIPRSLLFLWMWVDFDGIFIWVFLK